MTSVPVFSPSWMLSAAIAAVALSCAAGGAIYLRRLDTTGEAAATWSAFLAGPGALQVAALAIGMLLPTLAALLGPFGEVRSEAAEVRQWPAVNPSAEPRFTTGYLDVGRHRYVEILSRVTKPADGRAVIVVYGVDEQGQAGEVRRLDVRAGMWSSWQSRNEAKRIRVGVERPDSGAKVATAVDVVLVLDQAPPQRLSDTFAPPPASTSTTSTQPAH
jgi:hypothetical protein